MKEMFAEVDILLDLAQFRQIVPDTTATYMDTDALILYHCCNCCEAYSGFCGTTTDLQWASPNFTRMTLQVCKHQCAYFIFIEIIISKRRQLVIFHLIL